MSAIFVTAGAAEHGWRRGGPNPEFDAGWERMNPGVPPPTIYTHPDGRTALLGREPVAEGDLRWHVSVRYGDPGVNGRIPTWDELVATAHELRPGVPFVVGIPPRSWWMNVHPHVLHLYETKDEAMIEQWRDQRQGDRPT